jgi:hypothetical protein
MDCECKNICGNCESVCVRCNHCTDCCECAQCIRCGPVEYVCVDGCCEDCCSSRCNVCNNCDEHVDLLCSECGYCVDGCCEGCNTNNDPRYSQKFTIKKPQSLTGFKHNASRRPISIELELAYVNDSESLIAWAKSTGAGLCEDGSIPDEGCEINTNPASGDLFIQDTRSLATALKKSDASVNDECGLHVHVDASDYSQYDLRRLILLWTMAERTMFEIGGIDRISNSYCKPCAEDYADLFARSNVRNWRKDLTHALYKSCNRETRENKRKKYRNSRYYALNIHSYFFRKTLEFRLHEATTEAHVLENWPLLCARLVDSAMRMRESELLGLVRSELASEDVLARLVPHLATWMRERLSERRANRNQNHANTIAENLASLEVGRNLISNIGTAEQILLPLEYH